MTANHRDPALGGSPDSVVFVAYFLNSADIMGIWGF